MELELQFRLNLFIFFTFSNEYIPYSSLKMKQAVVETDNLE